MKPVERAPNGIRTRATALKGQRPRPLDDEGGPVGDLRKHRGPPVGGPKYPGTRHTGPVLTVSAEEFDELVGRALDGVPRELALRMRNVAVFVEDESPDDGPVLLGLYEGIPLTSRDQFYAGVLPDRITIFRLPILRMCRTPEQVVEQVRVTVVHEIAHHFGIDDDRLHELGYG